MPECFYRASSVFCDTGENKTTLDSRLKTAGMTILIKEVFSGENSYTIELQTRTRKRAKRLFALH